MNQFVNRHKQDQIISELKVKEAEIIHQMQQFPKRFDPSKLKINIECPEPRDIAGGMNYKIQNQQPITPQHSDRTPQPVQTPPEKFQNT